MGTRKADRMEAFGKAVPEGTKVGVLPETFGQKDSLPPSVPPGSATGGNGERMGMRGETGKVTGVSDGDITEFMDLDKMEDGFARDFVASGGGRV